MSKEIIYNQNNTEGHHSTAFEFNGTELQKDGKCVTTRLADCYDVEITDPSQNQVIKYDETKLKWVNGDAGGGCNILEGYYYDDILGSGNEYFSTLFIDANTTANNRNGDWNTPFISLKECMDYLNENCVIFYSGVEINIVPKSDITIDSTNYLNHPYGNQIFLNCYDKTIFCISILNVTHTDIDDYTTYNIYETIPPIVLNNNHSININNLNINSDTFTLSGNISGTQISEPITMYGDDLYIGEAYISPDKYVLYKTNSTSLLVENNSNLRLLL